MQGRSDLIDRYQHLSTRSNADAIFLTYDKKIENAIFLPNSSFGEGRSKLLEAALLKEKYDYYIFSDDDVKFATGGWDKFEEELIKVKPLVAIPLFLAVFKVVKYHIKSLKYQLFIESDEQLIAFHRSVIEDGIIFPRQTQFDKKSWWIGAEIQIALIQNFYHNSAVQFNTIQVLNDESRKYPGRDLDATIHIKEARKWLDMQFRGNYKDIRKRNKLFSCRTNCSKIISWYRTLKFMFFNRKNKSIKNIRNILYSDSILLKQHLATINQKYPD